MACSEEVQRQLFRSLAVLLGPFVIVLPFSLVASSLRGSDPTLSTFVLFVGAFVWIIVVIYLFVRAIRVLKIGR